MRNPWIMAASLSGIGFYIAGAIILLTLGGRWLDNKYDTAPGWTITGLILGIIVAAYGTYNMLRPYIKGVNGKKEDKENQ